MATVSACSLPLLVSYVWASLRGGNTFLKKRGPGVAFSSHRRCFGKQSCHACNLS